MIRYNCYLVSRIDTEHKILISTASDLDDAYKAFHDYNSDYINKSYWKLIERERQRFEWVVDDWIQYK